MRSDPRTGYGSRVIVDSAVYRDGTRVAVPDDFAELHAACQAGDAVAWIGLYEPSREEIASIAREFDLHELAVEDAVKAHQRPKLERYGDSLFLVLRPARYVDETETVVFGEVAIFAGPQFVITVRHGDAPELGPVRQRLEERPELCGAARWPSCTRSSTTSSTATSLSSKASRTTSTRSRTRSSAAVPPFHDASTS